MKLVNPTDILNGNTFSYIEVFGVTNGMALATKSNDILYYIYDRYCMNPSCKCDDVILHFVQDEESEDHKGVEFAILLSLKNKKFKILNADGISKKQIQEIVKNILKNEGEAIQLFKKRYKEMKAAGEEALQGGKQINKGVVEPLQIKTERNAPCPCGSGKKYKKCCGSN